MAILSAIGTALAGLLFSGSLLAAKLITGALAFGLKLAFSYLGRPKARAYSAMQGEYHYGSRAPVATLYGTGLIKDPQSVFYARWGSGDKYNAEVFALANGWCDGLEPYIWMWGRRFDLTERAIIGNEVAHYGVEGFDELISIRFYDGRPGQLADMKLVADTANLERTWKETSIGAGLCHVVFETAFAEGKYDDGWPAPSFVLRGLREYDVRKDSTVAGGDGPHRIDDPATWQHTLSPAVHRMNYQLGLKALVSQRTLIGEGKSLGQLDLSSYVASMNVCDTVRAGKPTYQASLWVTAEDDHTEILAELDDAMAGYGLNRGGLSGVLAGAPQVPVLELTADDMPIDRPGDIQYRRSSYESFNHLSGQYTEPAKGWLPEDLKPVHVNADVAADGGRTRQRANDFLQVADADIAQYLLTIRYRQNRKGGRARQPVSRRVGFRAVEGKWIALDGRDWLVTNRDIDEQLRFTLTLAETGAEIYDDGEIEPGPIVDPPTTPVNPSLLSTVQNFKVEAGMLLGEDGYEHPVLRFTWDPPEDPTITAVRIEYQVNGGDGTIFKVTVGDAEAGAFVTGADVVPGAIYAAQATITTVPDRLKIWTGWKLTPTATGRMAVTAWLDKFDEASRGTLARLRADLDAARAEMALIAESVTDTASRVETNNSVAVRSQNGAAVAFQQLFAALSDDEGNLIAVATALTAVMAQVGDLMAEGLFKIEARAGAGEVLARIVLMVRASIEDEYKDAGLTLEVVSDGGDPPTLSSRVVIKADQFVVTDGENETLPLVFEGGILNIQDIRIMNAEIGTMKSINNKLQIQGLDASTFIRMLSAAA